MFNKTITHVDVLCDYKGFKLWLYLRNPCSITLRAALVFFDEQDGNQVDCRQTDAIPWSL